MSGGAFTWAGFGTRVASAGALYAVPTTSVMVPAGGSAQLQVRGMSLQPGSTIPAALLSLAEPSQPPDNVRITLYYGINWGYTETDPEQAVLAVWYAQDGTWRGDQHATAEQIYAAAAGSPGVPSWSPNGRSALQLASSGQVTLGEVAFAPSSLTPSVGSGTLTLTNTSSQELLVYLPYGTIFGSGPGAVLVWAVGEVTQVAPSATTGAAQPQPTDTVGVVENTPTQTATATTSAAAPPSKKAPGTPSPSPEAAQEASTTPQTAPGKKSAATATATSAPTDTATPAPTDTATQAPTSTATVEATIATVATVATTTSKVPAASQNAATDQAAAAPVPPDAPAAPAAPANKNNTAQSAAADNSAPTSSKVSGNNQNNVQAPPSADKANAEAQAPAPNNKASEITSEQAAPAQIAESNQGSKVDALAPAVTITTIPRPVGTSADPAENSAAIPPAVQTSGATPPPPAAVETGNPTAPAGSTGVPTTRPTSVRTGTPATAPTIRPTNTTTLPTADSTADTTPPGQNTPGADAAPTTDVPAVPTRELVPPEPTRLTDLEPTATPAVPVIVTDPGGGGTDGGQQDGVVVGSDSGTAPDVNPRTGGGQSSLPLLLSVSSLVLVLSGLQLRRLAKKQGHTEAS